ncbi:cupin domain-containing protein [Knoellia subterranea]|uniref:Cupin n=1 Tax=Knoellia subterranea KCTC 19937 TaxID=1385521 RepID=A0A0A0JJ36_9MICO|nr:cupin domain-containing protein [Knoellia subterranea]KGN37093.1 cupin [Knoellia subterranea KCTC 19937]
MTSLRVVAAGHVASDPLTVLLRSLDCGGDLGVVEMAMDAGEAGPPLHVHPTHGEGFFVLAGELSFQLGEEVVTGGPGTWAFAPRDTPHTLANHGTEPGRLLCVFAPGGFERRFERMLTDASGDGVDLPPSEAELATRLLGPPLTPPATRGR